MADISKNRSAGFVHFVISNINMEKNLAMRARLRRADNPATEYQAWEYLVRFGVSLTDQRERKAFGLVGAALAKAKHKPEDGEYGLGKALAGIYASDEQEQATARLRRLLGCSTLEELCDVLRPMLGLIAAKSRYDLSYARLLNDLLYFENNQRIKEQWAQDFFSHPEKQPDSTQTDEEEKQ